MDDIQNRNFVYNGWKTGGFIALLLILARLAAGIVLIASGAGVLFELAGWLGTLAVVGGCGSLR